MTDKEHVPGECMRCGLIPPVRAHLRRALGVAFALGALCGAAVMLLAWLLGWIVGEAIK